MTANFNEKIMNFDIANGYDAFIELFTMEEIYGMIELMDNGDYDLDNYPQEMKQAVITNYVREWLIEQINNGVYRGTRKLFDIWEMVN